MGSKKDIIPGAQAGDMDLRDRLAALNVMVADRDHRTAALVQGLLFSFGFRHMDVTTNGESALALLKSRPYDILITEWNMMPMDGVSLVKAIRRAKRDERIPKEIPIIMLTARADMQSVEVARDAGISEFVAKPFSAKTISNRIIRIIDNPRSFVESPDFVGPCRRRRQDMSVGPKERRTGTKGKVTPADAKLRKQLGEIDAASILDDLAVAEAQANLLKAEHDFIDWARDDIVRLEKAFNAIKVRPSNQKAMEDLVDAAYAIRSQAGIFGYKLGGEVATMLAEYLTAWRTRKNGGDLAPIFSTDNLLVISKHIDTIGVIFRQRIKESGHGIAMDMVHSLKQLTSKLG